MPRLCSKTSGAVVSVSDEKAARMGAEWELADKPSPRKTAASKSASSKTEK